MAIEQTMTDLGFTVDNKLAKTLVADATNPDLGGGDMSASGPYVVHQAWTKGEVRAWLEQNTSPDSHDVGEDEVSAILSHPRVLVVESPKGQVAVKPSETATIADVVSALG